MTMLSRMRTGAASVIEPKRSISAPSIIGASMRASAAPTQKCGP